jgi:transcriptional regulator with PAS, ATPase and Fis domain
LSEKRLTLNQLLTQAGQVKVPLIAVAPGDGQVARTAVEAGVDLIIATSAAFYRHLGFDSHASLLPYGNANQETESLLRQILYHAKSTPVVASVMSSDPTDDLRARLKTLRELGVEGILNLPTFGFIDGRFRRMLEREGLGIPREIEMLSIAREMGFITFAFVLDEHAAAEFARSGVDALIANLGSTRRVEDIYEKRDQLEHAIRRLNSIFEAAHKADANPLRFANGGPVTTPEDLEQVYRHTSVHGFVGGAAFETLPVSEIVASTIRHFKAVAPRRNDPSEERGLGEMIGRSPGICEVFELIKRIAPFNVNVCIEGESGTGKELVATLIHRLSHRSHNSFVTLNCGAIPETLVESELFGHEKGAFTGAHRRRLGKFELAHRGTLFLDEIGDLSAHAQVALLRALQQREITRIGAERPIPVDARIITASHQNLLKMVKAGRFRADLYYRLNNITLVLPPLRDRKEDIPILVEALLPKLQIQLNRKLIGLSAHFYEKLHHYTWPGNVRELQHVITQAALLENGPVLEGHFFKPEVDPDDAAAPIVRNNGSIKDTQLWALEKALRTANGNKSRAAASLGITRNTLYAWMRELEKMRMK